ncbi:Thioredoxin [Paracoccus isoporae]|uniref:Thioredoxin n=1 Tax=Paracoccus isoporae TaxID=591205 RepID=A0A1G6TP97_9RHOB|nr:DsbA family protein [Paracoccus isoporae]SDD30155.1 Thioredoxin [Paracoccus isoporae]
MSAQDDSKGRMTRRGVVLSGVAMAAWPLAGRAQEPHPNPMPEELRDVLERNPALPVAGNPDGDVTLTEFFDYNCTFCRRNIKAVQQIVSRDEDLRLVFREWPVFGEGSMFAAKASLATLNQGKYWQFHSAMMGLNARAEEATVMRVAREIGLDTEKLRADMEARAILDQIYETMDLADTMGLQGTPTFIAGHEARFGLQTLGDLQLLVAQARRNLL